MPTGLTDAPKTGFWIAPADNTGAKSSVETQLLPYPTFVEYPSTDLGEIQETADGRVVVQVSNLDPRRRVWHWSNFGPEIATYERQYQWMRTLLARDRRARGQSPYVYVFDGSSNLLELDRSIDFTGASLSGTTVTVPTMASLVNFNQLTNAWVEVLAATTGTDSPAVYERRRVVSASSATSLTIESAFSSDTLNNSHLLLSWTQPVWFKARVVEVGRDLRSEGGSVRYTDTRLVFVIDDDINTTLSNLGS